MVWPALPTGGKVENKSFSHAVTVLLHEAINPLKKLTQQNSLNSPILEFCLGRQNDCHRHACKVSYFPIVLKVATKQSIPWRSIFLLKSHASDININTGLHNINYYHYGTPSSQTYIDFRKVAPSSANKLVAKRTLIAHSILGGAHFNSCNSTIT